MITIDNILEIFHDNNIQIDIETLNADESLNEQGLDSLDFMSVLFAFEERYGISIPEDDIGSEKLGTISNMVNYLNAKIQTASN